MSLWESADCADWHAALDRYPAVIAAQGVNGLADLDRWYRDDLPALIAGREPPSLLHDELVRVTSWKMKRGVWREHNRRLVADNEASRVEAASREAFAGVPDPRKPVAVLSSLAGVGPATASAVLAAYCPEVYPFFDELVALQIPALGPVAFTAAYYGRYAAELRAQAARLTGVCPHGAWTAHAASQALWAAAGGKAHAP